MVGIVQSAPESDAAAALLSGVQAHPHARAVLAGAISPAGSPSHAYLFHGPAGSGKRSAARAFASILLADGAREPATVTRRVARGMHPDLTWVTPSGAAEMLVSDIEQPVVAAAARTPFESARRVFVLEGVERMNDQAANRMLKTLEEPAPFVHLILLTDHRQDVLATIASRCQLVRFDPLPSARIEQRLIDDDAAAAGSADAIDPVRAAACARLALGDARLAARLASPAGQALREHGERFVRCTLSGEAAQRRWVGLLEAAKAAGASAGEQLAERLGAELELLPSKERRKHERDGGDARRRVERRARTEALDLGLRLAELWLRDVWCVADAVPELVYAVDRRAELEHDAQRRDGAALRRGVQLIQETRWRLSLNVSEELALEALAYRLETLLAVD
jgi:DNA polymerase III subunit delta'